MDLVSPDIGLMFWMLLSFSILLFILGKFAWRPIMSALKKRESAINNALKSAEKAKAEMVTMSLENERLMKEARDERDKILKDARERSDEIINEASAKAAREADNIITSAKMDIQNEKDAALDQLKKTVAELSIQIAEKILQSEVENKEKQQKIIQESLQNLELN